MRRATIKKLTEEQKKERLAARRKKEKAERKVARKANEARKAKEKAEAEAEALRAKLGNLSAWLLKRVGGYYKAEPYPPEIRLGIRLYSELLDEFGTEAMAAAARRECAGLRRARVRRSSDQYHQPWSIEVGGSNGHWTLVYDEARLKEPEKPSESLMTPEQAEATIIAEAPGFDAKARERASPGRPGGWEVEISDERVGLRVRFLLETRAQADAVISAVRYVRQFYAKAQTDEATEQIEGAAPDEEDGPEADPRVKVESRDGERIVWARPAYIAEMTGLDQQRIREALYRAAKTDLLPAPLRTKSRAVWYHLNASLHFLRAKGMWQA